MSGRAHISNKTMLASALLALGHVPYAHAKLMTEDQIISLYQWDHNVLHAIEIINEFWNLTPKLIMEHRRKSAKDKGIIAKSDRILEREQEFRRRLLAKNAGEQPSRKSRWPKRRLRSGNNLRRRDRGG